MNKKKHSAIVVQIIFALLFWTGSYGHCLAQDTNFTYFSRVDSASTAKQKRNCTSFFKKIFGRNKKKFQKDTVAFKSKHKKSEDSTAIAQKLHKPLIDKDKGGINWTSLYTRGVSLNTGVSGFYNIVHAYQGFSILGIPLTAQAAGVLNNGQYEPAYSSYSINFDAQKYLSSLRTRAKGILLNKQAKGKLTSKPPINLSDSIKAFESVRKQLNSPKYEKAMNNCRQQFKKMEDSLQRYPGADTTQLHNLRQQMTSYQNMSKQYDRLLKLQENYSDLSSGHSLYKSNEANYEKEKLNNPQQVNSLLKKNNMLSKYEQFLSGIRKFNIGQCNEEISDFTLHNFLMRGIALGYKTGNIYMSGGYGKEQALINPYLLTGINVPEYNRTVEYMRIGVGSEQKSNLYTTMLHISTPTTASSLGKDNWVVDLSKKVVCAKNFNVEGEISQSFFNYPPNNQDLKPLSLLGKNNSNLAYAIKANGFIPFSHTSLKMGYERVESNYITLGNPYLLNGAYIYRIELSQPIGKKLFLSAGGNHTLQKLSDGAKQQDNWINASVRYRPSRHIILKFKYSPRQFRQQEGTVVENDITSNINQLSFIGNSYNHIFGRELYTTLFIGNFQYTTPGSSTFLNQNTNYSYYMLNEVFFLSDSESIALTGNESRSNWTGKLSQFIGQGTYKMILRKGLVITSGMQWLKAPEYMQNAVGILASVGKNFGHWGRFSLQLNCRNNINKPFYVPTAQLIISANTAIMW